MLTWILVRASRMLDWLLVVLVVFTLVAICQFMIDFLSPKEKEEEDQK